ncbi:MAG: RNA polymerase sigma factor [Pirellulaceae bacterium]|nr:RNA polymerase sigma factor [Planctomycetales bacterium]
MDGDPWDRVYRFALSLSRHTQDAEDLTQECFLRINRQTTPPEQPLAWCFRVVRNLWLDRCRQREVRGEDAGQDLGSLSGNERDPAVVASFNEELTRVWRHMMDLPDRQREVLYLRAIEQMSAAEVAETLQLSHANVKATLSLARKRMRETCDPMPSEESRS